MSDIAVFLGNRIRELRKAQNISQEELAYRSSINPAHLGQIERAQKNPTLDTIYQIATSLGISLSELFDPYVEVKDYSVENPTLDRINDYVGGMTVGQQKELLKVIKIMMNFK